MKKLILFACLFLVSVCNLKAQKQRLTLFETIKQLIPDSTGKQNLGNWNSLQANKSITQWFGNLWCGGPTCSINGAIAILPDKSLEGSDNTNAWTFDAMGQKTGYDYLENSAVFVHFTGQLNQMPDILFAGQNYKAAVYKFCKKYSYVIYTLQLPGKQKVWLKFYNATSNKGSVAATFNVFLTEHARLPYEDCK